jgi:hypothetical protein
MNVNKKRVKDLSFTQNFLQGETVYLVKISVSCLVQFEHSIQYMPISRMEYTILASKLQKAYYATTSAG